VLYIPCSEVLDIQSIREVLDKDYHVEVKVVAAVYRVCARLIKLKLYEGRVVLFRMLSEVRAVDYHREIDNRVYNRSSKPMTHHATNHSCSHHVNRTGKRKMGRI
jgi:hypothetical protein